MDQMDEIQQQWLEARLAWEISEESYRTAKEALEQVTIDYHVAVNNWLRRRKDESMQ